MNPYFYIFGTPLLTVNRQIVLKLRLGPFGIFPAGAKEKALSESFVFSRFTAVFPILVFITGILFLGETSNRIIIDTCMNFITFNY
jgi:hypothetical protein